MTDRSPEAQEPKHGAAAPDQTHRGRVRIPVTAVLIVEVAAVPRALDWEEGPLPWPLPRDRFPDHVSSSTADRATREDFFHPRVHELLYGTEAAPRRWHRWLDDPRSLVSGWRVVALETVAYPSEIVSGGLVIFHCALGPTEEDIPRSVASLANLRASLDPDRRRDGRDDVSRLLRDLLPGARITSKRTGFVLSHVVFPAEPPPGLIAGCRAQPWLQWSRLLASANEVAALPGPLMSATPQDFDIELSQSWGTSVLRTGVSFVGREGYEHTDFHQMGQSLIHSTHLDVAILALIQRDCLAAISDSIETLWRPGGSRRVISLEERMVRFRTQIWWSDVTNSVQANELLHGLQRAFDLERTQKHLHSDIRDASALFTAKRAERTNLLLKVIAVVGAFFGFQALVAEPGWRLAVGGLSLALLGWVVLASWDRWQERR